MLIRIASPLRGEAILMSTHNIGLYEDLTKIIFELSSNTHLISSADTIKTMEDERPQFFLSENQYLNVIVSLKLSIL